LIISLPETDWQTYLKENSISHLQPGQGLGGDHSFWNKYLWKELLKNLLALNPQSIAVSLFFDKGLEIPEMSLDEQEIFHDKRIYWTAELDALGRILLPKFATAGGQNTGILSMKADPDGIVRRFSSNTLQIPHMALKLAQKAGTDTKALDTTDHLINFQGPSDTFPTVHFSEILNNQIDPSRIKNKIIIIGADGAKFFKVTTPVGGLSQAEALANMTDNLLNKKRFRRLSLFKSAIGLILIIALALWIQTYYPQSFALVFFIWLATAIASFSAWIFDSYYFWTPVLAPIVQLGVLYFVILGHQLSLAERKTWGLEQEKKYMFQVEQLKNNFVGLFSHDLKTPIAKIQAIVDRLLAQNPKHQFVEDLTSLRGASNELHRYIQSILQVIRVESLDFKIKREVADINELVNKILDQLAPLAKEKSIKLEKSLETIFSIELDRQLIEEVLINVVENAIKYTEVGGHIKVTTNEKAESVVIVVEDTGRGIDVDDQKRIWEKFFRGQDVGLQTKGSGLGLYLVKYFVDLHGGEVFIESQKGIGSKVGFSLPLFDDMQGQEIERLRIEV